MRKVTARELHALGVKGGPDVPLPIDPVQLSKIQMCASLEKLFGDDTEKWIKALKKLKETATYREAAEHTKIAVLELLTELEKDIKASSSEGASSHSEKKGSSPLSSVLGETPNH